LKTQTKTYNHERFIAGEDSSTGLHIAIIGQSGCGKTNFGNSRVQAKFQSGDYCCITFDLDRLENVFFPFKETQPLLIDKMVKCGREPRGFPNIVYFPFVRDSDEEGSVMSADVPYYWRPFKIRMSDLTAEDLMALVDTRTPNAESLLRILFRANKKFKSIDDFLKMVIRLGGSTTLKIGDSEEFGVLSDKRVLNSLIRMITEIKSMGLICDDDNPYALDLKEIMFDKDYIYSFTFWNIVEEKVQYLVMSYILRNIVKLRRPQKDFSYPNLFLHIPEIQNWCPSASDASKMAMGSTSTKGLLIRIAREGRDRRIKLQVDCQDFSSVHPGLRNQITNFWIGRIYDEQIKKLESLYLTNIPNKYRKDFFNNLSFLDRGNFAHVWGINSFRKIAQVSPSQSFHKRAGQSVFDFVKERGVDFFLHEDDVVDKFPISIVDSQTKSSLDKQIKELEDARKEFSGIVKEEVKFELKLKSERSKKKEVLKRRIDKELAKDVELSRLENERKAKLETARRMYEDENRRVSEIAVNLQLHRDTIYNWIKKYRWIR